MVFFLVSAHLWNCFLCWDCWNGNWHLHLTRPCYVALRRVLIWVVNITVNNLLQTCHYLLRIHTIPCRIYLQCEGDSRTYKLEQSWGFWSDITFINIMSKIEIVQDTSQLIECQQVSIYDIKPISYDQQKSSYHVMITMQTWFNVVFKFTLALVCLSNCFFYVMALGGLYSLIYIKNSQS